MPTKMNLAAIVIAASAVVIAATGTAVAVTATQVNIVDPTAPSHAAHVDSSGRLTTAGVAATLDAWQFGDASGGGVDVFVTAPTTATLALTRLSVSSTEITTGTFLAELDQVPVTSSGACSTSGLYRSLSRDVVQVGSNVQDTYAAPLLVRAPSAGRAYCLDVYVFAETSSDTGLFYVQLTGYVASGTYTGIGDTSPAALTIRRRASR